MPMWGLWQVVWGMKEDPERAFLRQQWDEWLGRWLGHDMPTDLLDRCCAQVRGEALLVVTGRTGQRNRWKGGGEQNCTF